MKYGYENSSPEKIIGSYKYDGNMIIITYLDGTSSSLLKTPENERNLLNKMLMQAKERSESINLIEARIERFVNNASNLCLTLGVWVFSLSAMIVEYGKHPSDIIATFAWALANMGVAEYSKDFIEKIKEQKELEKYDIYLMIREALKNYTDDPRLYNRTGQEININTLDNYSLKDIKTIKKNLQRNKKYSCYFDE